MKLSTTLRIYLVLIGVAVVVGVGLLFLPPNVTFIVFVGVTLLGVSVGISALWRQGYIARLWRVVASIAAIIGRVISLIIHAVLFLLGSILRGVLQIGSRLGSALGQVVGVALDALTRLVRGFSSKVVGVLQRLVTLVVQIARTGADIISSLIRTVAEGFRRLVQGVRVLTARGTVYAISRVRLGAVALFRRIVEGVRRFITGLVPLVIRSAGRLRRGSIAAVHSAVLTTRSVSRQATTSIRRAPQSAPRDLKRLWHVVVSNVTHPLRVVDLVGVPLGVLAICAAQYLATRQEPVSQLDFLTAVNEIFRFDLLNPDNVFLAILLLMLGAALILVATRKMTFQLRHAIITHSPKFPRIGVVIPGLMAITVLLLAILITNLSLQHGSPPVVVLWVTILILLTLIAYIYDRRAGTTLSSIFTRRDILYIVLLLTIGLAICSYRLSQVPDSIIGDEGGFLERGSTIAQGKELLSFFDAGVYTYPLASSFYQGLFLNVFGASIWSWRFSSVVAGVLAVIPTYLLALNMFSRRIAIAASLVMITSAYFLAFSRMGYNNAQAIPMVALTLLFLYIALQRQSVFYATLAGLAGGIGFYTYTAGRLALVFGVLFMGFLFLRQAILFLVRRNDQQGLDLRIDVRTVAAFLITGTIAIAPLFILARVTDPTTLSEKTLETIFPNVDYALAYYKPEDLYRDHPVINYENQQFFFRPDLYGVLLARGVIMSVLVMHIGEIATTHYLVAPLPGSIAVIFYFIGLMIALWRSIRHSAFMALILWLASGMLFLSMIDTFPPRYQHLISVIPAIAILTAVGIVAFADYLQKVLRIKRTGVWVTVGLVYICAVSGLHSYFVDAQIQYRPLPEDIMLFHTAEAPQPESVIYVTPDKDWSPYLLKFLPSKATFYSTDLKGFRASTFGGIPADYCTFFFLPDDNDAVLASLQQKFPQAAIAPVHYLDHEQRTILESWSSSCNKMDQSF